jgi:polysaccharide pyruvyl transferase WcaK-like protein
MTHLYPTARVAIFNDTRRTSHYGCEFVMLTIEEQLRRRNIQPLFLWPMGRDWRSGIRDFGVFDGIDAIIVNGEGSIHHSATNSRAHYLTKTARYFSENFGIPSFLINATLYEIGDDIISNLTHFAGIWLRESSSMDLLMARGIAAGLAPDLTLMVDTPVAQTRPFPVLTTDSVIRGVGRRLKKLAREKTWHYSKLTHASRPLSQDCLGMVEVMRRYAKWLAAIVTLKNTRNRHEFLRYLASHNLVCTGRFHAVTLALATQTPYLAVESNTPKISSLTMDVFGTLDRVVPLAELGSVTDPLAFGWSRREREALSKFLMSSRNSIAMMFDGIRATIDSRRNWT